MTWLMENDIEMISIEMYEYDDGCWLMVRYDWIMTTDTNNRIMYG